jgi:hypothetical protein
MCFFGGGIDIACIDAGSGMYVADKQSKIFAQENAQINVRKRQTTRKGGTQSHWPKSKVVKDRVAGLPSRCSSAFLKLRFARSKKLWRCCNATILHIKMPTRPTLRPCFF